MQWLSWLDAKPRQLPENVGLALTKQFQLDTVATSNWSYFAQSGKFAGRPVRSFRIIDPSLIGKGFKGPMKYRDLDGGGYQVALQFEGYIEREGYVILRDRRPKPPAASLENSSTAQ
jgi:hypothetical protein